ncbi:MAG: exosome complex protein Rrp4 [Methanobrevibacter sp.]|jgi:exosome complex component RRP4|nr:exosome complex protein Rrp4 [Methanobrevibacter sp.]
MINVEDKELVVPGDVLAEEGYYSGKGTFNDGGKVLSSLIGLVSLRNKKISVIPIKSKYLPKKGDVVIGKITDVRFSIWEVDISSPYTGILPASEVFGREKKDLKKAFNLGENLFVRVIDVDEVKKVKLGLKGRGLGKFKGGILASIIPTKVPRLIGKKGSMINTIKEATNCKIAVGQNGIIWIRGDKEMELIAKDIIKLVEAEAHTSGLTNRVKNQLHILIFGKPLEEDENNNGFDDENNELKEDLTDNLTTSNIEQTGLDDKLNIDDEYFQPPKLENFKENIVDENKENTSSNDSVSDDEEKNHGKSNPFAYFKK